MGVAGSGVGREVGGDGGGGGVLGAGQDLAFGTFQEEMVLFELGAEGLDRDRQLAKLSAMTAASSANKRPQRTGPRSLGVQVAAVLAGRGLWVWCMA